MLDDLNAGALMGLTFEEIAERYPEEYAARKRDRLNYRSPGLGGEGYLDLIVRLRPLIVELERTTDNLMIITHRAVIRILVTYFLGIQRDGIGDVQMPRDTIYCFDIVSRLCSFHPVLWIYFHNERTWMLTALLGAVWDFYSTIQI